MLYKNNILAVILLVLTMTVAVENGISADNEAEHFIYIAQNTQNQEEDAEKTEPEPEIESTPLPPAKISITHEKPVPGIPGERKPSEKTGQKKQTPVTQKPPVKPTEKIQAPVVQKSATAKAEGTQSQSEKTPVTSVPSQTPTQKSASVPATASIPVPVPVPASVPTPGTSAAVETEKQEPSPQPVVVPQPEEDDESGVPPDILQRRRETEKAQKSTKVFEELSLFNVSLANFRTLKLINDDDLNLRGLVYGEERGYLIHILEGNNEGKFKEVWKSPSLNSPVRELFVKDIDIDGESEIIAYTANGNIFIYDYENRDQVYRTPEGTYQNINCMVVENMDDDPQLELFFIGVKSGQEQSGSGEPAGNLIQFDTKSLFDEWTSPNLYTAIDMLVGNVDNDPEPEIILNTGEILNLRFKDVEWKNPDGFGSRLYLIDLDDDNILELVTEYGESYVRIFDIDSRQEKW
jgi:hypothetical protein